MSKPTTESTSPRKLALYSGLLLVLLVLPVALSMIARPDRKQLYMGLPAVRGDAGCAVAAIFDDRRDSDAVFVGSSTMVAAMRPPLVDAYFSDKLHRAAKIEYLYLLRSRLDVHYIELADYFNTHRTKLVVLAMPQRFQEPDEPDETVCDLVRFGEMPEFFEGMSPKAKIAIYGEMVINGPHQLLNDLRPNVLAPEELTRQYLYADVENRYGHIDYFTIPFEQPHPDDLVKPSSPKLTFNSKDPEKDYSARFMKKIVDLCAQHGAKLLLINLPMTRDPNPRQSPVNLPAGTLDPNQTIVAADNFELFGDVPAPQLEKTYFLDAQHLTTAGATLYTAKLLPTVYGYFASLGHGGAP